MDYFKNYIIVSGHGTADDKFVAIDRAYRAAGIADYNLVQVSSILPEGAILRTPEDLRSELRKGSILHCALAQSVTNLQRMLTTAVAVARSQSRLDEIGVIMKFVDEYASDPSEWIHERMKELAEYQVKTAARQAMLDRGYSPADIMIEVASDTISKYIGQTDYHHFVASVSAVAFW